jgi:hypothetical protein
MLPLNPELRKLLENRIPDARDYAEEAARAILNVLAVNRPEPYPAMTSDQRNLRNALRAKARQLGNGSQVEGIEPLVDELAYHQWHRMVFARFLAENNLLMHPTGVSVSLQECGELAQEEGETDAWAVAAKYAALMLPGIFRQEDPESQVRFASEGQQKLETLLNSLPSPIFTADDALGWMYQFWQKKKKEEVNASERKIGGADLAPVTQLFTEDYMVRFLLENSLGAWWAARHPESTLIKEWQYLRFKEDGAPAAGAYPSWPERTSEVTVMDPCCGSGHFLVSAFEMLVKMHMEEEGLSIADAGEAVLRQNLFGLEIDLRCTQIATFALALAAWTSGGYRSLPVPNIACSGIPVQGQLDTWLKLTGDDSRLHAGLERLYHLFENAPDLGSLINPAELLDVDRMFVADYEQVAPILEHVLEKEKNTDDPVAEVFGVAAEGVAKAAKLLVNKYTLVVTNVPFLSRAKQDHTIMEFCKLNYPVSKRDLAAVFIERCRDFTRKNCTYAIVTPQNWLYMNSYRDLREKILRTQSWLFILRLGPRAFETISGEIVNVALSIFANTVPNPGHLMAGFDVTTFHSPLEKAQESVIVPLIFIKQSEQLKNPDMRISLQIMTFGSTLGDYATSNHGQGSFDNNCYSFNFWEMDQLLPGWVLQQTTGISGDFGGYNNVFRWEDGIGMLYKYMQAKAALGYSSGKWKAGVNIWGKQGIAISGIQTFFVNQYLGYSFDENVAVIIPKNPNYFPAIWHFCKSEEFVNEVRLLDKSLKVSCELFLKLPFDLKHWQKIAEKAGPLPEPHSDDPTQWLFKGHPLGSTDPLQVAVARLLGYKWRQQHPDGLDQYLDDDGIVCLPPVAGEKPLSERLRELLATEYGAHWSPQLQSELLEQVEAPGKTLEDWLRDDFFTQHCRLFHNRPFIWHIWDGRKDGFSALVNYHKHDSVRLDKLIYTYLGDWIRFQRARRDHGEPGADGRLVAALELEKKLKLIKEGEPPYDLYVRWKSLDKQPIGWEPDLNDGVRLNIRPFVTAGVLRSKFTINWNKDRGKNPDGSERINDLHFTIAEKLAAKHKAGN